MELTQNLGTFTFTSQIRNNTFNFGLWAEIKVFSRSIIANLCSKMNVTILKSFNKVAIKRTPDFRVRSARPQCLNIGDVRIPHAHPHAHTSKSVVLNTLFSTF